jgi:hypothetical protein
MRRRAGERAGTHSGLLEAHRLAVPCFPPVRALPHPVTFQVETAAFSSPSCLRGKPASRRQAVASTPTGRPSTPDVCDQPSRVLPAADQAAAALGARSSTTSRSGLVAGRGCAARGWTPCGSPAARHQPRPRRTTATTDAPGGCAPSSAGGAAEPRRPFGVHQPGDRDVRRVGDEQMDVDVLTVHPGQLHADFGTPTGEHLAKVPRSSPVSTRHRCLVTKTNLHVEAPCRPCCNPPATIATKTDATPR